MHGSCGAERSGPCWLNRPGIVSECGPEFALSEETVHLLNTAFDAFKARGGGVCRTTPQPLKAESGVIGLFGDTAINLSTVHSLLPHQIDHRGLYLY